ncbi:hypothetical protein DPSP01_014567 [Paraphaeosphaeria sporulosa]
MAQRSDARYLTALQPVAGRGLGVVAEADIQRGTRILAESPLLSTRHSTLCEPQAVIEQFEGLDRSSQALYLELYSYEESPFKLAYEQLMAKRWHELLPVHQKAYLIWTANAFGDSNAVYLHASRFNHSCIPNVEVHWNPALEKQTCHAIRDIKAGEELTITYIPLYLARIERQARLHHWGFQCACAACEDTELGNATETKRMQLIKYADELSNGLRDGSETPWTKSLVRAAKLAKLQVAEGLLGGRSLRPSYHLATKACLKGRGYRMATYWIRKALEIDHYCMGDDHPKYREELDVAKTLAETAEGSAPLHDSVKRYYADDAMTPQEAQLQKYGTLVQMFANTAKSSVKAGDCLTAHLWADRLLRTTRQIENCPYDGDIEELERVVQDLSLNASPSMPMPRSALAWACT